MRSIQSSLLFIMLSIIVAIQHPSTATAQGWTWPENPENLKVLPDTISPEMLSQTMRGFTSALGVRCEHCHVGEAGRPLSEFDFPADEKREKRAAREMLRMVQSINSDVISKLEDPSGASVTCFTCHRGQPTPPEELDRLLTDTVEKEGSAAALAQYDKLHAEFFGTGVYNFGPRTFMRVADRLMEQEQSDDAIAILERGVKEHPQDALISYYMSQAYLAKADTTLARLYLEGALKLNPDSEFFRQELKALVH